MNFWVITCGIKPIALKIVISRKLKLDPLFKGVAGQVNGLEV